MTAVAGRSACTVQAKPRMHVQGAALAWCVYRVCSWHTFWVWAGNRFSKYAQTQQMDEKLRNFNDHSKGSPEEFSSAGMGSGRQEKERNQQNRGDSPQVLLG